MYDIRDASSLNPNWHTVTNFVRLTYSGCLSVSLSLSFDPSFFLSSLTHTDLCTQEEDVRETRYLVLNVKYGNQGSISLKTEVTGFGRGSDNSVESYLNLSVKVTISFVDLNYPQTTIYLNPKMSVSTLIPYIDP